MKLSPDAELKDLSRLGPKVIIMAINSGDTAWMLIATGLVMLMTPALGFFEAGFVRSKNSLSVLMQMISGLGILSILWIIIGFSLVFAPSYNGIIGNLNWLFFNNVPIYTSLDYAPTIPGISFASFQMMFAVITPLLITGAFAEKMKWNSYLIFIILWSIFIYYPLAHWVWGKGWLSQLGVFDFAGGIVIHTSAGMGSIASAIVIGRRKNFGYEVVKPHNVPLAVLGATLLWIGWFGFNAGSAFSSGGLAANTLIVTQVASASSALVWILLSWKKAGKASLTAGINGAIAGLAGVTAASGFITVQGSLFLGILVGLASFFGIMLLKERLKIDDVLDVGSVHGITGIIGSLAIGIMATSYVNPSGPIGMLYGNPIQLAIQALGVGVAVALGFVGTLAIMKIIDITMGLRVKEKEEDIGLDVSQHSERAYLE